MNYELILNYYMTYYPQYSVLGLNLIDSLAKFCYSY